MKAKNILYKVLWAILLIVSLPILFIGFGVYGLYAIVTKEVDYENDRDSESE